MSVWKVSNCLIIAKKTQLAYLEQWHLSPPTLTSYYFLQVLCLGTYTFILAILTFFKRVTKALLFFSSAVTKMAVKAFPTLENRAGVTEECR